MASVLDCRMRQDGCNLNPGFNEYERFASFGFDGKRVSTSKPVAGLKELSPESMRPLFTLVCLVATMVVSCTGSRDHTEHVTGFINGKPIVFAPAFQRKLVNQSISLLESCSYADFHFTNILATIQRKPYLHFTFSEPRVVGVRVPARLAPSGKIEVQLSDMVITLPLSSGIILVNSNQDTLYFAKFNCKIATELEKLVKEASNP
jgi:hypothetical protein